MAIGRDSVLEPGIADGMGTVTEPVMAIDPGPTRSAFVLWNGEGIIRAGIEPNNDVRVWRLPFDGLLLIEWVSHRGWKAEHAEVYDMVRWIGRFQETQLAARQRGGCELVPRHEIKRWHCAGKAPKDSDVRAALIDKYGPPFYTQIVTPTGKKGQPLKARAKRFPGVTGPLSADMWQAFALATYWTERLDAGILGANP